MAKAPTRKKVKKDVADGIAHIHASFNNTITDNTVADNSWAGISIPFEVSTPAHNTITGNNITNNGFLSVKGCKRGHDY